MVFPRVRKRVWERWKQATGRHLSKRQIAYASQSVTPLTAKPKISENPWKRDEVRWWSLNGNIFKKVVRTYFPETPLETKTQVIFCYDASGRLISRRVNGLFGYRVLEHDPPGRQFGKGKL